MNLLIGGLSLLFLSCIQCNKEEFPFLTLSNGKVRGFYGKSYSGRDFMQFVGIPYAKPPIKSLRFEEPEPMGSWSGIWIANRQSKCIQIDHNSLPEGGLTSGSEDCLHINVFVPGKQIAAERNLDVIVHIHGGAFMFGCAQCYAGPNYLMERDVILVNFNYRLGIFGFLSTEDKTQPGNLGMKDQVMALKWVKENIKQFGGNPDSITITGLSAGGASVQYHLLSPLSRGLYTRAISVSGSSLNAWTMQENPKKVARLVAKESGCDFKDSEKFIKCLKKRPADQLVEITRILRPWLYNPFSPLSLVVDKWSDSPFLPSHPFDLLKNGKMNDVPWITSVTTAEGLYPAIDFIVKEKNFDDLNERWNEIAPFILHYHERGDNANAISEKIRKYYIGDGQITKDNYPEIIQLIGDYLFVVGVEVSARYAAQSNKSPVYMYQYNYTGEEMESLATLLGGVKEKYGVCHGDDMMFVFSNVHEGKLPKNDEAMMNTLLDLWVNFAKNGKISIDNWKPVDKDAKSLLNYLYIGSANDIEMRQAKELGHRTFWDSLSIKINGNKNQFIRDEL